MRARHRAMLLPLLATFLASSCGPRGLPELESGVPEDVVRANAIGMALLSQQRPGEAEAELRRALSRRPSDPVLLLNTAIALIELGRSGDAEPLVRQAVRLDPRMPQARYQLALLEKEAGRFEPALEHFRKVAAEDPEDVTAQYQIGSTLARLGRETEAEAAYRRAIQFDPTHVASLYGLGRLLLQQGDPEEGRRLVEESQRVRARSGEGGLAESLGGQYGMRGRYALAADYQTGGIAAPSAVPMVFSPVREARSRASASADGGAATPWTLAPLGMEGADPALIFADAAGVHAVSLESARTIAPPPPGGSHAVALAAGDVDGDGEVELVALAHRPAEDRGVLELSLLRRRDDGAFAWRVGGRQRTSPAIAVTGDPGDVVLLLVDLDHDGDLDVFASWNRAPARDEGGVTRAFLGTNDGSGRFRLDLQLGAGRVAPEAGPWSREAAAFSDLDSDRDVDLVAGEGDRITVWSNRRDGTFAAVSAPAPRPTSVAVRALEVADLDKDGFMDVLVSTGAAPFLCPNRSGRIGPCRPLHDGEEDMPEEARSGTAAVRPPAPVHCGIAVLDADNDGFLDVVSSHGDRFVLYRNEGRGRFAPPAEVGAGNPLAAFDADADGDPDLAVRTAEGAFALLRNDTRSDHHWLEVRPQGVRDNRFGIGAKVEVLSGGLRQKLEVSRPLPVHFGLGPRASVDVVRILWPGGVLQDELRVAPDRLAPIAQLDRKGTSCPLLYAWRGGGWRFVTDFLGGSAIGYRHGGGELSVPDTDEYVLVEEGIEEVGGRLRLRFNNQLEEVLFFDRVELVAVDHPRGTELHPDERLTPGPPWPEFRLFASSDVRPVVAAREVETNRDATVLLAERDRRYADGFRLLPFKGYAEPHTLEIALGALPADRRVVLLLDGWIDYADSTSNVEASEAGVELRPPRLLVADASDGWREASGSMGFPAGLPKTITVDLTGRLDPRAPRVRIETNMRIHWDRARVMVGGEDTPVRVLRLTPARAELRFGSFPRETSPDGRPPFFYDPDRADRTSPWKAHAGLYTAFGDVTAHLAVSDDRFVVTRNGDEVEVSFKAMPPPAPGMRRSWLFYADGFGKDMDPNSAASEDVGPLPFHGMPPYPYGADVAPPAATLDSVKGGRRVLPSRLDPTGAVPLVLRPSQ